MKVARQTTLRDHIALSGVGVHSGLPVTLTLHPADAGTGVRFLRTRIEGCADREVAADIAAVTATEFATVLGDASGPLVSTAEHVLSALAGLGVDNAIVEVDGPEAPIMDGSAAPFVAAIDQVGIQTLEGARRYLKVLKPICVAIGDSVGELRPNPRGFRVEAEVDFSNAVIGRQSLALDVRPDIFRREIARARTFGFMRDVAKLWNLGYALGASLENTLVISDNRILNPEGTRFPDEFVRHKVLDAIGDFALAGGPLRATYRTLRGGHKLNHAVLCALMADPGAWTWAEDTQAPRTPRGHAELGLWASPAFGPDLS
ncbi:MAG: UDP-3-O-acyl-N-acetylglucosamine deacetylase [Hyphomicrobiales bacterium]|nr:UDP-3-O-acyl-N-acetylglucosamine deacetylase [Hyphomicrobiales bacterium]